MLRLAVLSALLALCAANGVSLVKKGPAMFHRQAAPLGIVDPSYRCGGVGTPFQLRIDGCEGYCLLTPGRIYACEKDFMPSSAAPSLSLKVLVCFLGNCNEVLDVVLPNSSVQPGFIYTAKYSIVPNDILSGNTVEFRGYIYHTDTNLLEVCVSAFADIL